MLLGSLPGRRDLRLELTACFHGSLQVPECASHTQAPVIFYPPDPRTFRMENERVESRSHLVSRMLSGSWREADFPPLMISAAQLDEVTPLLYGSGAAREEIEPILIKGWAAASLYPERGLRPYGDIDLLVRPAQYEAAAEILARPEAGDCWVDLHRSLSELDDRSNADLFSRARLLPLKQSTVRVLSLEDHLALLTVHLLKHGAWRPLWLCDIGAAIESLPAEFDWDTCLGSSKRRAGWIKVGIGLAAHLLGASTDRLPAFIDAGELPRWLIEAVRKEWQNPLATNQPPTKHPVPIASQLRNPAGLWRAVCERWPNPIIATISINGQLNRYPRLPYQLGNWAMRAARFLFHAPANG